MTPEEQVMEQGRLEGEYQNDQERQAAQEAMDALDEAREAYTNFQVAWNEVGRHVRKLSGRMTYERVDAYPGWNGTRDVGAGRDMEGWMDEVQEAVEDVLYGDNSEEGQER